MCDSANGLKFLLARHHLTYNLFCQAILFTAYNELDDEAVGEVLQHDC